MVIKETFTDWPFHNGLNLKILTFGVKVMILENWGKSLEISWEVRDSSMCGVFNVYNFFKIYLMVEFGRYG